MLYGNEGQRVRDIIRKICADLEVDIVAGNVRLDHVHLLVSVPPQVSVSKLIPSWNVFEIKYKYLEDLSDLKNYMRSALRGCRV